jgi:hypothetical protein
MKSSKKKSSTTTFSPPAVVGRRGAINVNNPKHEQVLGSAAAIVAREAVNDEDDSEHAGGVRALYPISEWDDWFCDWIEANGGPIGKLISTRILRRIVINAPIVLGFCLTCTILHVLIRYGGLASWERTLAIHDRIIFWTRSSALGQQSPQGQHCSSFISRSHRGARIRVDQYLDHFSHCRHRLGGGTHIGGK